MWLRDQVVEAIVARNEADILLVREGGIIAMRPLIIHASSKSRSDAPRRVLHIEYANRKVVPAPLHLAVV